MLRQKTKHFYSLFHCYGAASLHLSRWYQSTPRSQRWVCLAGVHLTHEVGCLMRLREFSLPSCCSCQWRSQRQACHPVHLLIPNKCRSFIGIRLRIFAHKEKRPFWQCWVLRVLIRSRWISLIQFLCFSTRISGADFSSSPPSITLSHLFHDSQKSLSAHETEDFKVFSSPYLQKFTGAKLRHKSWRNKNDLTREVQYHCKLFIWM